MPRTNRIVVDTPLGPLSAWWNVDGTLRVEWGKSTASDAKNALDRPFPARLADRLARAARGESAKFDDIPTPKGTPFQQRCWAAARGIPAGRTLTYGELAKRAGVPGAARAAGQAMRRNPIALIVPCHRVVASNGLGGYSGTANGSDRRCRTKQALLQREGATTSHG